MESLQIIRAHNREALNEITVQIEHLILTKHWYELGLALTELLSLPDVTGIRKEIYDNLVSIYENSLEQVQLAKIIELVVIDADTADYAIEFLKEGLKKVTSETARQWLKLQIVKQMIRGEMYEAALASIFELQSQIVQGTDLSVRSLFYKVRMDLDKARGDFDSFYENGFLFLSTSRDVSDRTLAHDLCVSALCSKTVFSFDELAGHAIIKNLEGTEDQWLMELIHLMERGRTECIAEFYEKFLSLLQENSQFTDYVDLIAMKVRLSVLQELIFQRPFESRKFDFDEVAQRCAVEKNEVELLVLKALANGLIKGFIDEVDEKFVVTWCKTKTLSKKRLSHLKEQIDRWIKRVHEQRILMVERAQPVIG